MTDVVVERGHLKRHQQEKLESVLDEERLYFISSACPFLFSYPSSSFGVRFIISLSFSLYSSLTLPVTGKYGTLDVMLQKIQIIKTCLQASKYCL
jgi:hypothetical protein